MRFKLSIIIAVLLAAAPIWAHHGSTGFDQKKPVHLVGKISMLDWSNPHIVIHLDVAGADGKVATWLVNTLPPNAAIRRGFLKTSFAVGTEISVEGYQALDGSNHVNGTNIALGDGQQIVTPDCFDNGPYCYKPADGKGNRIE
jgi:Family of unknown function (DUF6152)